MTIQAKYEHGVFRPLQDISIEEGTIVEVYVPVEMCPRSALSVGALPFAGMWKDREDLEDSVVYVKRLRGELHG